MANRYRASAFWRYLALLFGSGAGLLTAPANASSLTSNSPFIPAGFRSEPVEAAAPPPARPAPSNHLVLKGFYELDGAYVVIIQDQQSQASHWLHANESNGPYQLERFDPLTGQAEVRQGGQRYTLELAEANPRAALAIQRQQHLQAQQQKRVEALSPRASANPTAPTSFAKAADVRLLTLEERQRLEEAQYQAALAELQRHTLGLKEASTSGTSEPGQPAGESPPMANGLPQMPSLNADGQRRLQEGQPLTSEQYRLMTLPDRAAYDRFIASAHQP